MRVVVVARMLHNPPILLANQDEVVPVCRLVVRYAKSESPTLE